VAVAFDVERRATLRLEADSRSFPSRPGIVTVCGAREERQRLLVRIWSCAAESPLTPPGAP
jgi:hypothetical protein